MTARSLFPAQILALCLALGCPASGGKPPGSEGDADTDADTDTDGDSGDTSEPGDSGETGETGDPPAPETDCGNLADDDGDNLTDCDDPDCAAADVCLVPPTELDCTDTLDEDEDGATDCDDDDCAEAFACLTCVDEDIGSAVGTGLAEDTIVGQGNDHDLSCDPSSTSEDVALYWTSPADAEYRFYVHGNDYDAAIELVTPDCTDTSLDCDGEARDGNPDAQVIYTVPEGRSVIVIVDGAQSAGGSYVLDVLPTDEYACDDGVDEDDDGSADCEDTGCWLDAACLSGSEVDCENDRDDDGDGSTDCDDTECSELDVCNPPNEVDCGDGRDDDHDDLTDCDDDDCATAMECVSSCADEDLGSATGDAVATGTTVGGGDDGDPSCAYSEGAEDYTYYWTAPATGTWVFTTLGSSYDTVLVVEDDTCTASELGCDDDDVDTTSYVSVDLDEGQGVVVRVDGYYTYSGEYQLNISSGSEMDCRDGADDDDDGLTDCDDTDCDEATVCIPEPVCDDGLDDDEDGLTDCDDTDCDADLACTHPCVEDSLGEAIGAAVTTGSTTARDDDYDGSCGGSGSGDIGWLWTAPADATYTFDLDGTTFDAVLSLAESDCDGAELSCSDTVSAGGAPTASVTLTEGEQVRVYVDGLDASGDYVLNVWADSEIDCTDDGDEDLDGATDCDDSDCSAEPVCTVEAICDDAADDDGDGYIDCLDAYCDDDAACDSSGADSDLGTETGDPVATGSTVGAGDDWSPSCSSSYAEDYAYAWVSTETKAWTFSTAGTGYDTILAVFTPDGSELGCDDDSGGYPASMVTATVEEGTMVYVVVDGYADSTGSYTLAIY